MDVAQIKQTIRRELPTIMRDDPEIRQLVLRLSRNQFAEVKQETESRFDRILDELRREREASEKKWAENQAASEKKWAENQKALRQMQETSKADREASEKKWAENQAASEKKWAENQAASEKKWAENQAALRQMQEASEKKWAENQAASEKKWAENQKALRQMQKESKADREASEKRWAENQAAINRMLKKYNSSIGALGARWGLHTEQSFRNALKGILEEDFPIEVLNITEFDDEGYVFGRPDQVELDIIIKNGILIICEIKSSMSRSDMYVFDRKVTFYEDRHQKKASRKLVISPMVEEHAKRVAKKLGIEVYSYVYDIETL